MIKPATKTRMERFDDYMGRATALLEVGFTAKAHQKDAMDYCNRAFDEVMGLIGEELLTGRDKGKVDDKSKGWNAMYNGRPMAHVWAPKHAALFAPFPDLVALADKAAALRATCKATALVPKKPSARATALAVDDAKRMHCQICGRAILAETGVIAHHGYERPGMGEQTSSCRGARELPYEADRAVILRLIPSAVEREKALIEHLADMKAERIPARLYYTRSERMGGGRRIQFPMPVDFTRETLPFALHFAPHAFDLNGRPHIHADGTIYDYYGTKKNVPAFDYYLAQALAGFKTELWQATDWRKYLEKRRDEWKLTHAYHGYNGWLPVAA